MLLDTFLKYIIRLLNHLLRLSWIDYDTNAITIQRAYRKHLFRVKLGRLILEHESFTKEPDDQKNISFLYKLCKCFNATLR